jgi:hypothetical protein
LQPSLRKAKITASAPWILLHGNFADHFRFEERIPAKITAFPCSGFYSKAFFSRSVHQSFLWKTGLLFQLQLLAQSPGQD